MTAPAHIRFEKHYIPEPNSGCWLWFGATDNGGYGNLHVNTKMVIAHRFSYELHKGKIPDGMHIDHLCRMRCCVNPDHLEAVSHKENIRRGTNVHRNKTHCPKGHPYSAENTYFRKDGGRNCNECVRHHSLMYQRRKREVHYGGQ